MARSYIQTENYINNEKKQQAYRTTIYSKIEEENSDMYFIAQSGDRLDTLANRFYGDPGLWVLIARANNLKTMNVSAGTSLRIPQTGAN